MSMGLVYMVHMDFDFFLICLLSLNMYVFDLEQIIFLKTVDYSMSFLMLFTWNFFLQTSREALKKCNIFFTGVGGGL